MQNPEKFQIKPNDPLYITPNTEVPEPSMLPDWEAGTPLFDKTVDSAFEVECFEEDENEELIQKTVQIKVRASESTLKTRSIIDGRNPGGQPWGKHCSRNQGVSILREGREIILTNAWCQGYDPRERWWGLELDFPSELDDFLGVTNNKQSADKLNQSSGIPSAGDGAIFAPALIQSTSSISIPLRWALSGELFCQLQTVNRLACEIDPFGKPTPYFPNFLLLLDVPRNLVPLFKHTAF